MSENNINQLISLTLAKVEILKLKADSYNWSCHVDGKTKQSLEDALLEIDKMLSLLKTKE